MLESDGAVVLEEQIACLVAVGGHLPYMVGVSRPVVQPDVLFQPLGRKLVRLTVVLDGVFGVRIVDAAWQFIEIDKWQRLVESYMPYGKYGKQGNQPNHDSVGVDIVNAAHGILYTARRH